MSGYDIAVKISLIENVTRGLTAMSGAFAKTGADAKKLEETMARIGKMTMMGGALLGAGAMGIKGLDATVEAASKYQKAVADFKTLNLSAHENGEMEAKAADIAHKNLGSTLTGNVKLIQDLHTAFGDLHHALGTSEDFAKYETVMKQAFGEHKADGLVNAAAKALEHRGDKVVGNSEEFQKELQAMSRVELATKGRVSAKDYLAASQTGKMAYMNLDSSYLYGKGAAMMTTMNGGDKFGTMLMTAYSSLIGGHMDGKAKNFLSEIGMYDEGFSKKRQKQIHDAIKALPPEQQREAVASLGGQTALSGGLKDQYVDLMKSPDKLAATMAEKIRERFGKDLSNEQVAEMMGTNFNRNTGMFLGEQILNTNKFDKDAKVFNKAMDYNQGYDNYMGTQEGSSQAMHAQWENLKTVLGQSLLPVVQSLTAGITSLVSSLTSFAQAHPTITAFIMGTVALLAVFAVIAGVVLLVTAGFSALALVMGIISLPVLAFVALLAVLAGVLVAVVAAWKNADIKGFWQRIGQQIVAVWNSLKASASAIWNGIRTSLVGVWNSIKSAAVSVWNGIRNTLVTVWNSIRSAAISVWNSIRSALINAWNAIRSAALAVWNAIKAVIIAAWNAIKSVISGAMSSAQGIVNSGFSAIVSAISNWIGQAVSAVQSALGAVGSAIGGMMSRAGAAVKSGINTIARGAGLQTHVSFKVDGRTMAQGVVHHMNASAYRGAGGHSYDGSRGRVMA